MSTNDSGRDSVARALWQELVHLANLCAGSQLIESEAERRQRAWRTHTNVTNVVLRAKVAEGSDVSSELREHLHWSPPPAPHKLQELIEDLAAGLESQADRAMTALRAGGGRELDMATAPNTAGQPRSIELAGLIDRAYDVSRRVRLDMSDTRFVIDGNAKELYALGNRLREIEREMRAMLSLPAEVRPRGWPNLASIVEQLQHSLTGPEVVTAEMSRSDEGTTAEFAFRDEHLTILLELVGAERLIKASELDGKSGMPHYDRLLELLREMECATPPLVDRPRGARSGWMATEAARAELARRGLIETD